MNSMFRSLINLKTIIVGSNFNTSKVTYMEEYFLCNRA
ncbi:MAG: hypothetical protein HUJ51_02610 [Eggerthellaceae bacterium]|nr:hypothetical protein [Eggerthellaceae bacterium]